MDFNFFHQNEPTSYFFFPLTFWNILADGQLTNALLSMHYQEKTSDNDQETRGNSIKKKISYSYIFIPDYVNFQT